MAKLNPRRKVALDNPEGIKAMAERLREQARPYFKWLLVVVVVVAVGLGAWLVNTRIKAGQEEKAAAALTRVTPKVDLKKPSAAMAKSLEQFVQKYRGSRAARDAQLLRANLLYRLKQYGEAAKAYESLLKAGAPGWDMLVNESLSYCYEGLGNYKKAAAILKPVVEQTSGPLQSEVMQHLAMLYDQAQEPKEAAVYWRKLAEQPPNKVLAPYFQQKLAAAKAKEKK